MVCKVCGCEIPPERLEAVPETRTCVQHSTQKAMIGFMISEFSKGTAPALHMVDPGDKEALRQARRANRRSR